MAKEKIKVQCRISTEGALFQETQSLLAAAQLTSSQAECNEAS